MHACSGTKGKKIKLKEEKMTIPTSEIPLTIITKTSGLILTKITHYLEQTSHQLDEILSVFIRGSL